MITYWLVGEEPALRAARRAERLRRKSDQSAPSSFLRSLSSSSSVRRREPRLESPRRSVRWASSYHQPLVKPSQSPLITNPWYSPASGDASPISLSHNGQRSFKRTSLDAPRPSHL